MLNLTEEEFDELRAAAPAGPQKVVAPDMDDAAEALLHHFGYASFRPGQERVIEAILGGRDVLAVMPTGAGKSVCYQIPAALLPGLTIVVSPLISLMGDQVRALKEAGIRGSYLNSSLTARQQEVVMTRALAGWYDVMYVAPERLGDPRFREFAAQASVPLVAVDEAHCVSQWGQDFRPAYQGIAAFVASLPHRPPVAALTATATDRVRADIQELLELRAPLVMVSGFDRPNLHFSTFELTPKKREQWIANYVRAHASQSGIIYAMTRKKVDELAEHLREAGIAAVAYHAGYDNADRAAAQERFVHDDAQVMVATNAFGMGIDKSDVRYVINVGLPLSLEEYYQEAGRAGRDGEPAECYLLWSRGDIRTAHFFIDNTEFPPETTEHERQVLLESREHLLSQMIGYAMSTHCLRARMLAYFGQDLDLDAGHGADNAAGEKNGVRGCGSCSVCNEETPDRYLRAERRHVFGSGGAAERAERFDDERRASLNSDADEELFQRLRALRKQLADDAGVPPYVVFNDATLRAMVRRRPQDEDELLAISGVGQVKLERYGEAFLAEIAGA